MLDFTDPVLKGMSPPHTIYRAHVVEKLRVASVAGLYGMSRANFGAGNESVIAQ